MKYFRRVCSMALIAILFINTAYASSVTSEEQEYTSDPDRVIHIVGYDYDVLTTGSSEEIEAALYPSGIVFPTKYMDFADFIPYDGTDINDFVGDLLCEYYPTPGNTYTWPEYCAARRYCYYATARAFNKGPVCEAIKELENTKRWSVYKDCTDVRLGDTEHFHNAAFLMKDFMVYAATTDDTFENHELLPELYKLRDDGFYLSICFASVLTLPRCFEDIYTPTTDSLYIALKTMPNYWTFFHLQFYPSTVCYSVYADGIYYPDLIDSETKNYIHPCWTMLEHDDVEWTCTFDVDWERYENATSDSGEEIDSEGQSIPDAVDSDISGEDTALNDGESGTSTNIPVTDETLVDEKGDSSSTKKLDEAPGDSFNVSEDFKTGIRDVDSITGTSKQKQYNARDVVTILALIFVLVAIVAVWINKWYKEKHDPSRKWKR